MSWLLFLSHYTQPDFGNLAKKTNKLQLLTIPYSHYVEFARWSLQYSSVSFIEHKYAPFQHVFPLLACRIKKGKKHLPKTSKLKLIRQENESNRKLEHSGATNVPVCCLPSGDILVDSWSIAEHAGNSAGLEACPPDLLDLLDQEIGPLTRHIAYYYILKESNRNIWDALATHKKGYIWRFLWWAGLGSFVTKHMIDSFQVNNKELHAYSKQKLGIAFDSIGDRLKQSSGQYILGANVSVADIAIASLVSPVIFPELYAEGEYFQMFLQLESQDAEFAAELAHWRNTDAGRFCSRMYKEHRADRH